VAEKGALEVGFALRPIPEAEFAELLRVIRVDRRKRLDQRVLQPEPGRPQTTIYLVDGELVAAYVNPGQYFRRIT
jgi:hypothetical protein